MYNEIGTSTIIEGSEICMQQQNGDSQFRKRLLHIILGCYASSGIFNIVFVSAEVAPYSKTGGLGDVCGSLPIALAARGNRVMVISPRYMNGVDDSNFSGAFDAQCRIKIGCFDGEHEIAFFHEFRAGVDWVCQQPLSFLFATIENILSYRTGLCIQSVSSIEKSLL